MLIQVKVSQCSGAIWKVQKTDVAKMRKEGGVGNGERARKLENEK